MSSRFPRDDRGYPPRERSPARYGDRRPSLAPFGSSYSGRVNDYGPSSSRDAVPRGPRGASESRPPVSSGPRGRGFGGPAALRDFRDGSFGGDRAADRWRDVDYDRRDRRPSPTRARTPARDRDDSRDRSLKDIDTDRARRLSRDGPLSAGSNLSDPPRTTTSVRGGFGRGRGRSDWDYRTASRAFTSDDRDTFRTRSRSRGPRRDRERSVDSRDFDRRDDYRDRREEDRRPFRDREDRDDSFFKRDQQPRADTRPPFEPRTSAHASLPQTPQTERPLVSRSAVAERGSAVDLRRDYDSTRRASVISDQGAQKDNRREAVKPDIRAEASRYQPRAASPPPAVPQFGTFRAPSSNVWINPATQHKSLSAASSPASSQLSKAPPTAPKAQLAASPPTAPKADRVLEQSRLNTEGTAGVRLDPGKAFDDIQLSDSWQSRGKYGKPVSPRTTSTAPVQNRDDVSSSTSLVGRLPVPPAAPRAMTQGQTMLNTSPAPLARDLPPRQTIGNISGSPTSFPDNVPTGPRADRSISQTLRSTPSWPRAPNVINRQPFPSPQRTINPPANIFAPIIPTKRDAAGEDKEHHNTLEVDHSAKDHEVDAERERKVPRIGTSSSAAEAISLEEHVVTPSNTLTDLQDEPAAAAKIVDIDMEDAPAQASETTEPTDKKTIVKTDVSSEDEGMFDEADFANHEARYMETRQRLVERKMDTSSRQLRSTTPLEQLSLLSAMRKVSSKIEFKRPIPSETLVVEDIVSNAANDALPLDPLAPIGPENYFEDTDMAEDESYSEESPLVLSSPEPQLSAKGPPTPLTVPEQHFSARYAELSSLLKDKLVAAHEKEMDTQERLGIEYRALYSVWKRSAREMDRARQQAEQQAEKEAAEAEEAPAGPATHSVPMMTPTESGRRTHKQFTTEYEMQKVLEESKREEEERRRKAALEESEAKRAEEREADIPPMLDPEEARRRCYRDTNRIRDPRDAIRVWEFAPPKDTFTPEEDEVMRKLYDKNSKQFGKIADGLNAMLGSSRTYKDCINHYYATKFDKPYKKPTTGRGKGRRTVVKKTARGRVLQTFTNADPDGELGEGDSAAVQVTDSGRPRRAAAPKFGEGNMDLDSSLGTPGRTMGPPTGENGEPVAKGKRQKGGAQKGVKKTRAQPLAARPTVSPTKLDKDKKDKLSLAQTEPFPSIEPVRSIENSNPSANMLQPSSYFDSNAPPYREQAELQPTAGLSTKERPRTLSNQRTGASSYWSVNEENYFRACLAHYGTEDKAFEKISGHLGTKTTQMVKNHYLKTKQEGKYPDIIEAAEHANVRIQRGENLGPPPAPAPSQRRRQEHPQPALPRTLAPNTTQEVIDLEKSPALKPGLPAHPSPPSMPAQSRYAPPGSIIPFSSQATSSAGVQPGAQAHFSTTSHTSAAGASQPQRQHQTGPRMGYFIDRPPGAHRTSLSSREQPPIDISTPRMDPASLRTIDRIKSEHEPTHRQSFGHAQDVPPQLPMHPQHTREESVHRLSNPMYPTLSSQMQIHGRELQDRFTADRRTESLYGASMTRVAPSQASEPFRTQPQPASTPPAQQAASAPPKEPSRRVAIMSMLNPEPEEERPRKKEPESSSIISQQVPPSRPFSRPSIASAFPPPSSSHSTPVTEVSHRDSFPHAAHRDSWPGRQQFASQAQTAHSALSNSPHLQQLQPQLGDPRAPLRGGDYRPGHDILGPALRHGLNPTPPPPGSAYHSRTPSLAQPQQQAPPQAHPGPPAGQLHPNPFSQVQPPNSGAPQQRQLDLQQTLQRGDSSVGHPRFSGIHSGLGRGFDRQREAMFDRFREQDPRDVRMTPAEGGDAAALRSAMQRVQAREREREERARLETEAREAEREAREQERRMGYFRY